LAYFLLKINFVLVYISILWFAAFGRTPGNPFLFDPGLQRVMKIFFAVFLMTGALYSFAGSPEETPARPPLVLNRQDICSEQWMCRDDDTLSAIEKTTAQGERPLRVASYNVHKCTGMDARRDVDRIAEAIRSLDADIVSLQEVLSGPGEVPSAQVRYLARKTGMYAAVSAPTKRKKDGLYGNALLSRFPITEARLHDISMTGFEPRGVIDADILIGDRSVRVVVTHLGLWPSEGNRQAARLLQLLPERPESPLILMGDMNSWVPGSPRLRGLMKRLGVPVSMASYPAFFAVLPLDKIWVLTEGTPATGGVHRTGVTRMASDHLPLVASFYLPPSKI
jgi:endonuclease/exonuclease/phosphatase family metal-dependent hydrolase